MANTSAAIKASIAKQITCTDCGETFTRTGYRQKRCSTCHYEHQRQRDRHRGPHRSKRGSIRITCTACGHTNRRTPRVQHQVMRSWVAGRCDHCGQPIPIACVAANPAPSTTPVTIRPTIRCAWCNTILRKRLGHGRMYCSEQCLRITLGYKPTVTPIEHHDCIGCGAAFISRRNIDTRYCSPRCAKRTLKSRRRSHIADGDTIGVAQLGRRDNWRCHLCGGHVPNRPYQARDNDPTIDHLVPVSAGGAHVWSNVALAHNKCNWERGATAPAQLRII